MNVKIAKPLLIENEFIIKFVMVQLRPCDNMLMYTRNCKCQCASNLIILSDKKMKCQHTVIGFFGGTIMSILSQAAFNRLTSSTSFGLNGIYTLSSPSESSWSEESMALTATNQR
uniref:Uncharacterized protein n=1 Tax=Glossina pallidipes TaxID=7398 RepID=A0A1B0A0V2_GLOPL